MIQKIWEILTTFSEESQKAALAKCKELGLDPNRGVVSLDESYINLNSATVVLMDAIEKKKLIQLPITVQQTLLGHLENISKFQTGLTSGTDEVVNLAAAIEQLNTAIWQYGLGNLSDEVLGYQTKLNQLKNLELEVARIRGELTSGLALKSRLDQLVADSQTAKDTLQAGVAASEEISRKASEHLDVTVEADQKAAALLATIQQNEITSSKQLAATSQSNYTAPLE